MVVNFGVVYRRKQMHITSRKIPVVVDKVSLGDSEVRVDTALGVEETVCVYTGEHQINRLAISWTRQGGSLIQESVISIDNQESRVSRNIQVDYSYAPITSLGTPTQLVFTVRNESESKQLLKIEVQPQSSFLLAGQLSFSVLFSAGQSTAYHYLLVPKQTGQCIMPQVMVYTYKKTDNLWVNAT